MGWVGGRIGSGHDFNMRIELNWYKSGVLAKPEQGRSGI